MKDPSKVPSKVETTPVDDSVLETLLAEPKLQSNWKRLGAALEVNANRLNYFYRCYLYQNDYEKGKAMFHEWKQTAGDNATKENLQKALKLAGIKINLPP